MVWGWMDGRIKDVRASGNMRQRAGIAQSTHSSGGAPYPTGASYCFLIAAVGVIPVSLRDRYSEMGRDSE